MLRVLIVDDSPVARELLREVIDTADELSVAGIATNGKEAIAMAIECCPDVITMDIQMPLMDGYEATRRIMSTEPIPIVVVSGSERDLEIEKSMKALEAGALTVISKPPSPASAQFQTHRDMLISTIVNMAQVRVVRRREVPLESETTDATATLGTGFDRRFRAVAMAASTGGPQALQIVLGKIPAEFPLPIFLVQHISTGFTDGFCTWLATTTPLEICTPQHGATPQPGTVYVAPENVHLGISCDGSIQLIDAPPVAGFCPSATTLFDTAGSVMRDELIAVVLTGMGRDGCDGLHTVRKHNGYIVAQDEDSCIVYGMPAAVVEAGLHDLVLPLKSIGRCIRNLAMSRMT